jgi:hypothetical protein
MKFTLFVGLRDFYVKVTPTVFVSNTCRHFMKDIELSVNNLGKLKINV